MPKKTPDYDNVFKTMKTKNQRLFIAVINDAFGKDYPMDAKVEVLPSEGYLTEGETTDGSKKIEGQVVSYESANVILEEFTKEYIVEKRLFPYIPFYIARYEKEIAFGNSIEDAAKDLEYFRDEMVRLHEEGELSDDEIVDLMGFVNTIVTHITDGNQNEERLVNIMGGTVIETESEKLISQGISQGKAQMIIEMGQEEGLADLVILKKLQDKIGLSLEQAVAYLKKYGKQLV